MSSFQDLRDAYPSLSIMPFGSFLGLDKQASASLAPLQGGRVERLQGLPPFLYSGPRGKRITDQCESTNLSHQGSSLILNKWVHYLEKIKMPKGMEKLLSCPPESSLPAGSPTAKPR